VTKRNDSETQKSVAKKKRKNYTRMPRLAPQDYRGSGSAAGGEGGSATATPTQQGTMFGANDAAAEFRIKVSWQTNLEYAVASDRATGYIYIYFFTYCF